MYSVRPPDRGHASMRRTLITRALVGIVLLVGLVLSVDVAVTNGKTARGAQLAEFALGDLTPDQASTALERLSVSAAAPVVLETDSGQATVDPAALGLGFDAEATLHRLLEQPRNPWHRLTVLFGATYDVRPVVTLDVDAFNEELDAQRKTLERAAVEGGVHFDGTTPVADLPSAGLRINRAAARDTLTRQWLSGGPIRLPMESFDPTVSAETVQATLDGPARQVTDSSVTLTGAGAGASVTVSPTQMGELVTFVPDGAGGLQPAVSQRNLKRALGDQLAATESKPVNASFSLASGAPRVVSARDGARVNARETAAAIAATSVVTDRRTGIVFEALRPKLTTEKARGLGVKQVVAEYTTEGFSGPSGENIRLVAQQVDGAVVLPGDVFSLNGHTGPRGAAQGYVTSTIIDHGHASKAIGGGISQFATTLYNAAYFAGLEDVTHTEHDYYISRYPEAREATVFEGAIDLQFRNNTDTGLLIETIWSPSSITIRLWGTPHFEVESFTGERSDPTSPQEVVLPNDDNCIPSNGAPGFTTSNTRVVRNGKTGAEVSRTTRTVRYAPEPIVRCR
ncbi:MAG: VanW family protein [Gordonia sp. (in: high G+C Gram-positive bacteria)]|uniref:VanW family protein n=1 Tax=Gordonia sp. (in: high G+C Gram-positive bacteria) TaxID=84139 RepID=UPI003BB6063B